MKSFNFPLVALGLAIGGAAVYMNDYIQDSGLDMYSPPPVGYSFPKPEPVQNASANGLKLLPSSTGEP